MRPVLQTDSRFYPNLEALRGVAALMVAWFHIGQTRYTDAAGISRSLIDHSDRLDPGWLNILAGIIGNGVGAVIIFFVLSGFVLTSLLCRFKTGQRPILSSFLIGRLLRIYPAVWSTLILFCSIYFVFGFYLSEPGAYTITNIAANFALIRVNIDGVMWSLQLELIAAPLIFVCVLGYRRFGYHALTIPLLVLVPLSFVGEWKRLIGPPGQFDQIYAFIVGMVAFYYGRRFVETFMNWRFSLSVTVLLFVAIRPLTGWGSNWSVLLESMIGAAIIATLAFKEFNITPPRVLRFYGRISYSFYLLHPLVLILVWWPSEFISVATNYCNPVLVTAVIVLVSMVIITPLAWLQYRYVELPGIRLGKMMARKWQASVLRNISPRADVQPALTEDLLTPLAASRNR